MKNDIILVGWKEWFSLPLLDIPLIKVKIDTGAKTSSLHAYDLKIINDGIDEYAEFIIHPIQKNDIISKKVRSLIVDKRRVKSSNGHTEERIVIRTPIQIGNLAWDIDITLTNRDIMHHRMLLGREAMSSLIVDPSKSFCQGLISKENALLEYSELI